MTSGPGERERHGRHRGRGQPQVHLGRRVSDQDRQGRTRLRGRLQRPAHRPSRHQPGAQEERRLAPRARPGGPLGHGPGRCAGSRDRRGPSGAASPHRLRAHLSASLAGVRGAAARRGLRGDPRVHSPRGGAHPARRGALGAREHAPGAAHGQADPGAPGGRRPHRGGRARPPHRGQDRRRARDVGRPVQSVGGAARGVVRHPRAEGRRPHPRAERSARAADGDGRDPARHQQLADGYPAGLRQHRRERGEAVWRAILRRLPGAGRSARSGRPPQRRARRPRYGRPRVPAAARRGSVRRGASGAGAARDQYRGHRDGYPRCRRRRSRRAARWAIGASSPCRCSGAGWPSAPSAWPAARRGRSRTSRRPCSGHSPIRR